MTQSSIIKIVVVGLGHIGPRHAQSVLKCNGAELVCFVDPSSQAETIVESFQCPLFKSIRDMLDGGTRPDAAIVCTPNSTHVAVTQELLLAGIDVLVEKPISTTVASGLDLLAVAKQTGAKLLVGHHRRFNPYMVSAKQVLSNNMIGKPIAVSGLWVAYKPSSYFDAPAEWRASAGNGGPILINMIHEVDILQYLLGPITRVHAEQTISQRGHAAEEGAAILLRFASGAVGTFILCDSSPSPHFFESTTGENPLIPKKGGFKGSGADVYRIFGTEGTLSVGDGVVTNYDGVEKTWSSQLTETRLQVGKEVPFDEQIEHFIRVINGVEQPRCTGEDGSRAVMICEAIKRAMIEGVAIDI